MAITLVLLPGKFHAHRSLEGYSPWGHKELDMTERLSTHIYNRSIDHETPQSDFPWPLVNGPGIHGQPMDRLYFDSQESMTLWKKMATHCSILAWEIPWTEEPGGLQSMGMQRIGYG